MATEGKVSGEKQKRHSRLVDMWAAPGLNPSNIDVISKLKSAEDRQFSKGMEITGKIFDKDTDKKTNEETGRWWYNGYGRQERRQIPFGIKTISFYR